MNKLAKPKDLFELHLKQEIKDRNLTEDDLRKPTWTQETKLAVIAAMSKSPVLFHFGIVPEWLGVSKDKITRGL